MKIACYVMMRNEAPMLGPFLDQLQALVDYCVIVDHGSTDDSIALVRARRGLNCALYHLKSPGYPQAPVATHFARMLLSNGDCDTLFFLDCDEFLPFADREALEGFLASHGDADVIRLNWLNCCPANFESNNIFANPFQRALERSPFQKLVLRSSLWQKAPDFSVTQGYHSVAHAAGAPVLALDTTDAFLIHVPIQSRTQIAIKLANGHNRLLRERTNLAGNHGHHWIEAARQLGRASFSDDALRSLALGYPQLALHPPPTSRILEFDFPYVKSEYRESSQHLAAQIGSLVQSEEELGMAEPTSFAVTNEAGEPILTPRHRNAAPADGSAPVPSRAKRPMVLALNALEQDFGSMIEPLFGLPTQLPTTAWEGHIPFMFVLFKLFAPKTYVELGVHTGASFIAACAAAKSYNVRCHLFGVDTWEGDDHSGHYEGDAIFQELKSHLAGSFPSATLVRARFSEARRLFSPDSVDLLHIDGLHTYDAVKTDFTEWFGAMAPRGVILFHDTCVYDKGFGVHRIWAELKRQFETIEFHHSHGLGVLLLDPSDPRLAPLVAVSRDDGAMHLYRDLAATVASTLRERMGYFESRAFEPAESSRSAQVEALKSELAAVYASTSWRISGPLRALKRLLA